MKETGGNAFPELNYERNEGWNNSGGMTLRDYFAAKAMQGWMATYGGGHPADDDAPESYADDIALCSYRIADAMVAERSKS